MPPLTMMANTKPENGGEAGQDRRDDNHATAGRAWSIAASGAHLVQHAATGTLSIRVVESSRSVSIRASRRWTSGVFRSCEHSAASAAMLSIEDSGGDRRSRLRYGCRCASECHFVEARLEVSAMIALISFVRGLSLPCRAPRPLASNSPKMLRIPGLVGRVLHLSDHHARAVQARGRKSGYSCAPARRRPENTCWSRFIQLMGDAARHHHRENRRDDHQHDQPDGNADDLPSDRLPDHFPRPLPRPGLDHAALSQSCGYLRNFGCAHCARRLYGPRRLRHRGKFVLLLASGWIMPAEILQQRHRVLDLDVEFDDVLARQKEEKSPSSGSAYTAETPRYAPTAGNRAATLSLGGCDTNTSDHMPGAGNSTRPTGAERRAGLREHRLENLLHRLVDRPDDGHAVEDLSPKPASRRPMKFAVRNPSSVSATNAITKPVPGTLNGR